MKKKFYKYGKSHKVVHPVSLPFSSASLFWLLVPTMLI